MSYNGSGVFSADSVGLPVITGTVISSTMFNAFTTDVATGLSTVICKDGQQTVTQNIPFANHKLTGVADGTASGDAVNYGQLTGSGGAASIGFIGAETGAEAWNAQDKMRETVSVFDNLTAAQKTNVEDYVGDIDITTRFMQVHNYLVSKGGGRMLIPAGCYGLDQLAWDTDTDCVEWVGEGNAAGSNGLGTMLKYIGAVDADTAFVLVSGAQYLNNAIRNLCINANSRAGYCMNLAAYNASANLQKLWNFERVCFAKGTRALIVGGDATWDVGDDDFVGGSSGSTTYDADYNSNIWRHCTFTPMATTRWGYVENVLTNAYQTIFYDPVFNGDASSLDAIENYWRTIAGNSLIVLNPFTPNIPTDAASNTSTVKFACVRRQQGSLTVYAGQSEEARYVYLNSAPTGNAATKLDSLQVNDSRNNGDGSEKICIESVGASPLVVTGCNFANTSSGLWSRRVKCAAATTSAMKLEDNDFGAYPVFNFCAPAGEWVVYPGRDAYDAGTAYAIGDQVVEATVSYTCIAPTTGNAPPNGTYWVLTFTASGGGGGTWGVGVPGDISSLIYSVYKNMMTVQWYLSTTTVTGTPTNLEMLLPLGVITPSTISTAGAICSVDTGATWVPTFASVTATFDKLNLFASVNSIVWTAGAKTVYARGSITFPFL